MSKQSFLVNTIDFENVKMLVRLEQAESTKGKNVIIDKKIRINGDDKILSREMMIEKKHDGKHTLKITILGS